MSGYVVEIVDECGVENFPALRVTEAIRWLLRRHDAAPGTTLSLVLADDARVQQLNAQYRGVDAPTDILSFPAGPLPDDAHEPPYLGDLIVAYPYTVRHAQEAGHALDDELVLLAIHGTLHLLGYDHDSAERQETMWHAQAEALRAADVPIEVPRFSFEDDPDG